MPTLLWGSRSCFYCGNKSRLTQPGIPRAWLCPHCSAMNHLDEYGEISDPPAQVGSPLQRRRYARSPSPEVMAGSAVLNRGFQFCDVCQRNQEIVQQLVAEYIPDEADPEFEFRDANVETYRFEQEQIYPPVCENCRPAAEASINQSNYRSRTAELLRRKELGKQWLRNVNSPAWNRRMRWIAIRKWIYIYSVVVGLIWHTFGVFAKRKEDSFQVDSVRHLQKCFAQLWTDAEVNAQCYIGNIPYLLANTALIAELITITWHTKLKKKMNSINSRVKGADELLYARLAALIFRVATFAREVPKQDSFHNEDRFANELFWFKALNVISGSLIFLLAIWNWTGVQLVDLERRALASKRPAPNLRASPSGILPPVSSGRSNAGPYDTMAPLFTSTMAARSGMGGQNYPPSPVLTGERESSTTSDNEDEWTPRARPRVRPRQYDPDAMDWSPSKPSQPSHFGRAPAPVERNPWRRRRSSSTSPVEPRFVPAGAHTSLQPPDALNNPFSTRVPGMPGKPPSPWKPRGWNPVPDFVRNASPFAMFGRGSNNNAAHGAQNLAEASTVQRDRDIFAQPKLQYDAHAYTNQPYQQTGLEDRFGNIMGGLRQEPFDVGNVDGYAGQDRVVNRNAYEARRYVRDDIPLRPGELYRGADKDYL